MQRAARRLFHPVLFVLLAASFGATATAQCQLAWQPGDPVPTVHGHARAAVAWDPDGSGPAPAVLVVGGRFAVAAMLDTAIAAFDGANWSGLGTPPLTDVSTLAVWNGLLVAAGVDGSAQRIATYDGATWTSIGTTAGRFNATAIFQGDLVVGGFFAQIGSVPIQAVGRWNGTTWSPIGTGVTGEVMAIAVFGSLWVGGQLSVGGQGSPNLASWNGSAWTAAPTFDAPVRALAARNGTTAATSFLFAGGDFATVGGVPAARIARLTSSTGAWTAVPGLPGTSCRAIHVRSSGISFQLRAAVANAVSPDKVWLLSGSTWTSLGALLDDVELLPTALTLFNGEVVAAFETFPIAETTPSRAVRIHDGTDWRAPNGQGFDDSVAAVIAAGSDIVVTGRFDGYGGLALGRIARGGPGNWQPLGSGLSGGTGGQSLCTMPNGDLVVGGDFTGAGGVAAFRIARWDGTAWSPLGSGMNGEVHAVLAMPNGDVVAAGAFAVAGGAPANFIARWNGTQWAPLGAGMNNPVFALARTTNGDVYAAGVFTTAGGQPASRIARWNGSTWSALGSGLDDAGFALTALPDDHVVVGGFLGTAGGIPTPSVARWTGTTWVAQSTTFAAWDEDVDALVALPDGGYVAAGRTSFFGIGGPFGGANRNAARHPGDANSVQWDALDLRGNLVAGATRMPDGDLVFVGDFDGGGGLTSHGVAVLRPTCPATASAYGSGCTGAGGQNVLATVELPWVGGAFRGRATGIAPNGLVFAVTGFTPLQLSLPQLLPQGLPGCSILANTDLVLFTPAAGGVADTRVPLPNSPALAGVTLFHQVVGLELDAAGAFTAVSSSNGIALVVGVL